MRSAKGSSSVVQDEEEYEELDENSAKRETPSSSNPNNNSSNTNKDSKNTDKASAMRSKHSVTEQRRRSKINERFQILRDLIPHSDQKRDTASFLLEVINYVQLLQEKVQKFEGSFSGWNSEPTKLMPWRNSHWRVQSFVSPPQAINNGSGPGLAFTGKLDENNISMAPSMLAHTQNSMETETSKMMDHPLELADKGPLSLPLQANISPVHSDHILVHPQQRPVSDAQSSDCPMGDIKSLQDDLVVEGGTISISSAYSDGLLSNLTHALQSAGVDLSQAHISLQIDLGKRGNSAVIPGISVTKTHEDPPSDQASKPSDAVSGEHHAKKRLKT